MNMLINQLIEMFNREKCRRTLKKINIMKHYDIKWMIKIEIIIKWIRNILDCVLLLDYSTYLLISTKSLIN